MGEVNGQAPASRQQESWTQGWHCFPRSEGAWLRRSHNYQKYVGNVWLELIGYGKRHFGIGNTPAYLQYCEQY